MTNGHTPKQDPIARWTEEEVAREAAVEAARLRRDGQRPPGELILEGARLSGLATRLADQASPPRP